MLPTPIAVDFQLRVIEKLIAKRNAARETKAWSESDSIRDELIEMGVEVQDTPEGTKWRRI